MTRDAVRAEAAAKLILAFALRVTPVLVETG